MVDTWPASLPQCLLLADFASGFGDGRLRSEMDMGPAKVRRRSSAVPTPLSGHMIMTATQLATLKTFVTDTLAGGSLAFMFPSQDGGDALLVRFADRLPVWVRQGAYYDVSLDFEVLP